MEQGANHRVGIADSGDHPLGTLAVVEGLTERGKFLRLSLWWLPFNALWTALLTQGLQVQAEHWASPAKGSALSLLTGLGALSSLLSQFLSGPLSARCRHPLGRRRLFVLMGALLALPAFWLFAFAPSFPFVVLSLVLMQWWLNWAAAPMRAWLPDVVPPHRHGIASAHVGFWSLGGQVIGMLSIGFLLSPAFWGTSSRLQAEALGLRWLMAGSAIGFLLATLFALSLPDRSASLQVARPFLADWGSVCQHPDFLWLLASRFVINLGFYTAVAFLRWFLADTLQVADPARGTMVLGLLVTVASVPSLWLAGRWADRFSKRALCLSSGVLCGVGAMGIAFASHFAQTFLPALLLGIGTGAFGVANWALAVSLMPPGEGGKFFALWQLAFTLPQVFGPSLAGVIGDAGNRFYGAGVGWRLVLIGCVLLMMLGALLLLCVRERPPSH